jgi:hypothetical protein
VSFAFFIRRVEDYIERRRDDVGEPTNCAVTLVTSHDLDHCSHVIALSCMVSGLWRTRRYLCILQFILLFFFSLAFPESMMFYCVSFALIFQLLISQQ